MSKRTDEFKLRQLWIDAEKLQKMVVNKLNQVHILSTDEGAALEERLRDILSGGG